LVALALLQISSAGHQFKHNTDDLSTICSICLQLDRFDQTIADAPVCADPDGQYTHPVEIRLSCTATQSFQPYQSRAPPSI
jgi:hypothetical protein